MLKIPYTEVLARATNSAAVRKLRVLQCLRPHAVGTDEELADLDMRIDFLQQKMDDWCSDYEVTE